MTSWVAPGVTRRSIMRMRLVEVEPRSFSRVVPLRVVSVAKVLKVSVELVREVSNSVKGSPTRLSLS